MDLETIDSKVNRLGFAIKRLNDLTVSKIQTRYSTTNLFSDKGGQIQFGLIAPRYEFVEVEDRTVKQVVRDGAVLIEGAAPDPERPGFLDWKNKKITFSLGDKDIGDILYALEKGAVNKNGELVALFHKNVKDGGETSKTFKIKPGQTNSQGQMTYLVELYNSTDKNKVSVFVGGPDLMRIKVALQAAFPIILGWTA